MTDEMVEALLAQADQPEQLPQRKPAMMGPATPGTALPGDPDAHVMEAGVPTGKGILAQLAAKLSGYNAAEVFNPEMIKRLAAQAKPVMSKLMSEGAFAGERTTGSGMTGVAKRLQALQAPAGSLGRALPEYAPVGGESIVNALRPVAAKQLGPIEMAYQRLLQQGGR